MLFIFLGFFYSLTLITGPLRLGEPPQKKSVYYAPPVFFQHFSFGQKESLADSLWLRLIQDIDLCANEFSNPDAVRTENPNCDLSWSFRMYDIITELAPRFRLPHAIGGLTVSVMLDDYQGAKHLFDKAVKQFPDDWPILYRAAYHYLADLKRPHEAAELMERAAKAGAPEWLLLSSARLYTESGQRELGLKVLQDFLEKTEDESSRKIILQRIEKLKAQSEDP